MDFYFLKLSWKNVWRNKRRTFLTVNAMAAGVMALVALQNYYDAFHEQVVHNVIRYHSGHLLISAKGYQNNNLPSLYLKDTRLFEDRLKKNLAVKAYSTRALVQGLLSSSQGSANILISGVDPNHEKGVTKFSSNIIKGGYLLPGAKRQIVVGYRLAALLKLQIGSKAVVLTQGVDGSIGNELFLVSGIFKTDSEMDKTLAFVLLEDARKLLSLSKFGAHQIAIVLKNEKLLEGVQSNLTLQAKKSGAEVLTWKEIQKPVMAMIELNKSVNRLLMAIILVVAALGIANSILMSIMERTREFGVMMAIGTSKRELIRLVFTETILLSTVGAILGNCLGIGITLYFHRVGFDLRWLTSQKLVVQGAIIQTISYPNVHWQNSFRVTVVLFILAIVVSFLPIRQVTKLTAVKALRSN